MLINQKETRTQWFLALGILLLLGIATELIGNYVIMQILAAALMVIIPMLIAAMTGILLLRESNSESLRLIRLTPLPEKALIKSYIRKLVFHLRIPIAILIFFLGDFWYTIYLAPVMWSIGITLLTLTLSIAPIILGAAFLIKPPGKLEAKQAILALSIMFFSLSAIFGGLAVAGAFFWRDSCGHRLIEFGPHLMTCF
jgi:hypothetical protein